MLSVEDPSFFEGVKPVQFGGLPNLQDSCIVVGYPIGGEHVRHMRSPEGSYLQMACKCGS